MSSFAKLLGIWCEDCHRVMQSKKALEEHRRTVHSAAPLIYHCPMPKCGFHSSDWSLSVHLASEHGPIQCAGCGKRLMTALDIFEHRSHSLEPYQATQPNKETKKPAAQGFCSFKPMGQPKKTPPVALPYTRAFPENPQTDPQRVSTPHAEGEDTTKEAAAACPEEVQRSPSMARFQDVPGSPMMAGVQEVQGSSMMEGLQGVRRKHSLGKAARFQDVPGSPMQTGFQDVLRSPMQTGFQDVLRSPMQTGFQDVLRSPMQTGFQDVLRSPMQTGFQDVLRSPMQTGFQAGDCSPTEDVTEDSVYSTPRGGDRQVTEEELLQNTNSLPGSGFNTFWFSPKY